MQNGLEDLFSLTEFLRFYPIDNPSNTRLHILNHLGRNDEQALKNLRSLMTVVALRRTKAMCQTSRRSDRVEMITLSAMEREQYHLVLARVRHMRFNLARDSPHTLLSALTKLRRICSHGVLDLSANLEQSVKRSEEISTCRICGDSIPLPTRQHEGFYDDQRIELCHDCSLDTNHDTSLYFTSTSVSNQSKSEFFSGNIGTDGEISITACSEISVQPDEVSAVTLKCSSKLERVLSNLIGLQKVLNDDGTPVKRPVQLL